MAPQKTPEPIVQAFIDSKRSWIARHVKKQQVQIAQLPERDWADGETLYWLGQPITLRIHKGTQTHWMFNNGELHIFLSSRIKNKADKVRQQVQDFYQVHGHAWVQKHSPDIPVAQQLKPRSVTVKSFKSRWGSCSRRGDIALTWHLFAAPESIVRYVLVHELCHLQIFNHSKQFWQLVSYYEPNYDKAERWMKRYGNTILDTHFFSLSYDALSDAPA